MFVSLAIIVVSLVLGAYWFRYVCYLILETRAEQDHSESLSNVVRLNFRNVRRELRTASGPALDRLNVMLTQDYQVLCELLDDVGGVDPIERRMLTLNYKLLRGVFSVTKGFAASRAVSALSEMSSILNYFAGAIGQAAATR